MARLHAQRIIHGMFDPGGVLLPDQLEPTVT
jgi:hypothetical protein